MEVNLILESKKILNNYISTSITNTVTLLLNWEKCYGKNSHKRSGKDIYNIASKHLKNKRIEVLANHVTL